MSLPTYILNVSLVYISPGHFNALGTSTLVNPILTGKDIAYLLVLMFASSAQLRHETTQNPFQKGA